VDKSTIVISNSGIATISQRARTSVTDPSNVVRVSTKIPRRNSTRKRKKVNN